MGMVTDILDETNDYLIVEINFNLKIKIDSSNKKDRDLIRERSLEVGMFEVKFTDYYPDAEKYIYEGECKTVIFGRRQLVET
jgi:hypothetical protein